MLPDAGKEPGAGPDEVDAVGRGWTSRLGVRLQRRIAWAAGAVLVVLICHNLWWLVANERRRDHNYKVAVRPRRAAGLAADNRHPVVRGRIAVVYRLRDDLAGATLTIPPQMAEQTWNLTRVARLPVVVADAPTAIDPAEVERLARRATKTYQWLHSRKGKKRGIWQRMYVVAVPGSAGYVMAQTSDPTGPLFVLPQALYDEVALPSGGAGAKGKVP